MKIWFLLPVFVVACSGTTRVSDAYGNFEATETLIAAEATGRLLQFQIVEGDTLSMGQLIGVVDTTQLTLQINMLKASVQAIRTRAAGIDSQLAVVEEQIMVAERERRRIESLMEADAATSKQVDDVSGQVDVLRKQRSSIRAQKASVLSEMEPVKRQMEQIADQVRRCYVRNPVSGTVLTKLAEPGELVTFGKPLFKVADLETMFLRVYVSGAQLPNVKLGHKVDVIVDDGSGGINVRKGTIDWIASKAEFTPKVIQTREERVNLVYAVKIRVANPDGLFKIGMPGEARFMENH